MITIISSSTWRVNKGRSVTIIVLGFDTLCLQLVEQNTSTCILFHRVQIWCFLTGVKPPSQKKAKLSKTDAHYEKEKKMRTAKNMERQATLVAVHTRWHDDLQLLC